MFQPRKLPQGIFHFFFFFSKISKKNSPFFVFLSSLFHIILFYLFFCFVFLSGNTCTLLLRSFLPSPPTPLSPPPPPSPLPPSPLLTSPFLLPPPANTTFCSPDSKRRERRKKERERSRGCWSFWERGCQVLFSLLLAFLS